MSNRSLSVMQTNVGSSVGDTSSSLASLIKNWLNDRYKEVLRRMNFFATARNDYSFTTTGGTEDYVLPDDFGTELFVVDKTNGIQLARLDQQKWMEKHQADSDTQGTVYDYLILDSMVRKQPTSASVATVVSSSASDTSQTVYIRGIVSGREDYESITVTGTTNAVGTKSWDRILSVAKSAATVGTITVTTNSAAVTVAVLSREMLVHRVKIIRLVSTPIGSITVEISYIQKMLPMNNAYDYPVLDCEDALEAGATADAWRYKRQFAKAADLEVIFEKRVNDIIWQTENAPNVTHTFSPKPYDRNIT